MNVYRRPSDGREGKIGAKAEAAPLRFWSDAKPPAVHSEHVHRVRLTLTSRAQHTTQSTSDQPVLILLVRTGSGPWGPISKVPVEGAVTDPETESANTVTVVDQAQKLPEFHIDVASGLTGISAREVEVEIHEWRCLATVSSHHRPDDLPGLARGAMDWICNTAASHPDHHILLGLAVPQEVSVGMGLLASQVKHSKRLPNHLWPLNVVRKSGSEATPDFVIPGLDLGTKWEEFDLGQP